MQKHYIDKPEVAKQLVKRAKQLLLSKEMIEKRVANDTFENGF